jgi:enolase
MTPSIEHVFGREMLDSRGNPTVEVEITLKDGSLGRAMVPSGASKGQHEALELRDNDPKRYLGRGTRTALQHVNGFLAQILTGKSFSDLAALDRCMVEADGTKQKSKLGANAVLGVSLAYAHAVAVSRKEPLFLLLNEAMGLSRSDLALPVPLMNILNGGEHANNGLAIQEFMIVPHAFPSFSEALRAGVEVFHHLKKWLADKQLSTAVGDEGGFAPALASNEAALDAICEAIRLAGYQLGKEISLAMDAAASSFYDAATGNYALSYAGRKSQTRDRMVEFYGELIEKYPIVSIEDGLDENDWDGWRTLTQKFGKRTQLVGDDIFVTQTSFVQRGIDEKVANAVLVKVNQVGSLAETFDTMALCRKHQYRAIVSHRSGETEDVTIAHLAVGSGCGQIKTGSASRSERLAKYNELLRIEEWGRKHGVPMKFTDPFH